ncbi:MAG: DUF6878 family protein [Pseudomonadota bacterium]
MSDYLALATQAQEKNREILIEFLKTHGITVATVDYAGAGDSGDTCDLAVQPPELLVGLGEIKVKQHVVDVQYLGYGQRACSMREKEVALDEAVRDFAMCWVDSLHGGWENDDGACGTVTINVTDNQIVLEHTAYYTESSVHEHAM